MGDESHDLAIPRTHASITRAHGLRKTPFVVGKQDDGLSTLERDEERQQVDVTRLDASWVCDTGSYPVQNGESRFIHEALHHVGWDRIPTIPYERDIRICPRDNTANGQGNGGTCVCMLHSEFLAFVEEMAELPARDYQSTSCVRVPGSGEYVKVLSNFDKNATLTSMETVTKLLGHLGIGDGAQKIYLSLIRDGQASPRLLSQRTGITRPSVYDQLKVLMTHDLVVELDIEGKAVYAAGDVKRLDAAVREMIEELEVGRVQFEKELPALLSRTETVQPKIRFFEGKEGVMQLMKDILWHDHFTLHIVWPYKEMLSVLGEDFLLWFNERRMKRGIKVASIWPHALRTSRSHIFTHDGPDVERRYAEKGQIGKMGYLIYKNKVAFVSSGAEGFGFIVESTEFTSLQTMHFENLWQSLGKNRKG